MVRLTLPQAVADKYQKQADERGIDLEKLLAERLESSIGHTSQNPLYLTDTHRRELDLILKANVKNPGELLNFCRRFFQVNLNGLKVQVDPVIIERLRTRNVGHEDFSSYLSGLINKWAAEYVGLG